MKLSLPVVFLAALSAIASLLTDSETMAEEIFGRGAEWKFADGRKEATLPDTGEWRRLDFDDSAWRVVQTPLYYGEALFGTELADMRGNYSSVFLRKQFVIENPAEISHIQLEALSDDGFVAWINGREVARYNLAEGNLPHDAFALQGVEEPLKSQLFTVARPADLLLPGTNVLAIQAFNSSLAESSDFVFDAALFFFADEAPPEMEEVIPSPGSEARELVTVEVHFNEPIRGVEAGDLLINGTGATNVVEVAQGAFVFSFPQPADGEVTVAWRANHGITDLVGAAHPFAGGSWKYTLDSHSPAPGVFISEFMADNDRTLNDEDGESSDWIEIFNSGLSPANLAGWFLTDDIANLTKWSFPEVTIEPREYLVVFASEKNRTNVTGRLHTNFKLSTDGEYLALVTPGRKVASHFAPTYPRQFTDMSFGVAEGTTDTAGYFTKATPGAANASSGPGFGPEIQFSRASGTFITPFDLTLSLAAGGATIRYTLDGNLPTNGSALYSSPIRVTNSVQVRARAFQDGNLPGPPRSESYLLLSNNVAGFVSDLPVIVLHTLGRATPGSTRQTFTHISVYEPVGRQARLTDPPTFSTRGALKVRGSSTEGLPKTSFAMEFWDEFGLDSNRGILGLPPDSDWVLYAPNQYEPVLIHNPFIHQLSRDMGRYSPRTRFVEVYLNRLGGPISAANYNGIYVLEEKISIGRDRVNIDKLKPENLAPPEVTGGYLMKIDRLDPGDGGFSGGGANVGYIDPKEREIELPQRDPQEQYLRKYFGDFGRALATADWRDPKLGYPAYIDVDSWIDFHVLEVLSGNVDSLVLSTYFHKPRNGKIVFGPHWDFDRALGSTDGRDSNPRTWTTGPFFSGAWWPKLFADRDFWQKWVDRWQEARRNQFSRDYLNALVDRLADEVRAAQPRERARWRIALRGGTYQSEVSRMKNWLSNRIDFIDKQLAQPPVLSAPGGQVTPGYALQIEAAANATVYYTLNGSDPRLPQGGISPDAVAYTAPLTINQETRVIARTRNANVRQAGGPPAASSTPWSGPVTATFTVAPPPLVITEIMFHPENAPSGVYRDEDFEYLEIKNSSGKAVPLAGYRFISGIQFEFTPTNSLAALGPGERALVVKNRDAFASRYPEVTAVAGEYTGTLSNSRNRLTLVGPLQEPIADLEYDAARFPLADGPGFSLVPRDEILNSAGLDSLSNWRISARPGGSPGSVDPAPVSVPPVYVNELLPEIGNVQDSSVELFNPNASTVDISGWYLSDNFGKPQKYRLPNGSAIVPGGYFVLSRNSFPISDGTTFSFTADGGGIYLFSADAAGLLTGWMHGFEYDGAARNGSFARQIDSAGGESFIIQTNPSLGLANALPRVGPVVVNEIHYAPRTADSLGGKDDEFIELRNITSQAVPLFDPGRPASTWRLRGQVDFDFPPGLTISAAGYLILVGFDPAAYPWATAAFRGRFGIDTEITILGPWSGDLSNVGGAIRLLRPAPSALASLPPDGGLPYEVEEEVDYSALLPWPAPASGSGESLTRRVSAVFGNDPANWTLAGPTPGDEDDDGDGLGSRWELGNGLNPQSAAGDDGADGDPDADGLTNRQEMLAGTAARDGASRLELRAASNGPGVVTLTFEVPAGRSRTVQFRDNLVTGTWQNLRGILGSTNGGLAEVSDTFPGPMRYYRLVTP